MAASGDTVVMASRDGPRVYHMADVRLGGAFPFLGQGGAGHRRQIRETFTRAVDQGIELAPALVLITGNLFGTPFPSRDLAEFARTQLGRLTARSIPVMIAAGPLDALREKTYAAGALDELEDVGVFPGAPTTVEVAGGALTVVGASWSAVPIEADFLTALAGLPRRGDVIGAAHLSLPATEEGMRTLRRQIAASGARYLALGGSPTRRDLSANGVAAWCPGGPELIVPEAGEGAPLLVAFGEGAPIVTPKPVHRRRYAQFVLQPADYATAEELVEAIRALGDPQLAARVVLAGTALVNQFVDAAGLHARLADAFLALEIDDRSLPAAEALAAPAYPELSVAGKFVVVARGEMERAANDESRWRTGAALRLGLALLEGRRPS